MGFPVFGANGKIGYYDRYNHEKPEVLVGCRGSCGTVNMSEPRSWITGNAMVVHPKDEQLNQSFLYYLLMGGVSLSKCITGAAQPQITKANLTPVKIPLPPLPEQRRIVAFLDEAFHNTTHLTEKITRSLRETQKLKNVFLHQAFTSANTAGWEKVKLGEILKLEYGKPLPKEDRCTHGGFPAFGANGILCWSKKAYRNEPSIIVGRKGSAGEVNLTNGPFYPTDVTFFVVHNEKKALLKYLYYLLIQLNLKRLVQGVKPGINRNDVYALNTCIPPLPEQQRIVAFLDEAFTTIATLTTNAHNRLAEAQKLKNAYLQKAFESPEQILNTLTIRDPRP